MVKYVYDSWGNHDVTLLEQVYESQKSTHIGYLNPFRYRSYYYDTETKLYYLKTRYYDPVVGRFITIDDLSYIDPETINGLNLYAYCCNNPVMAVDPEGTSWWSDFWKWVGTAVAVIVTAVAGVILTVLTFGAAPLLGLGLAVCAGALMGFAGGVVGNIVTQVKNNGWGNVNFGDAFLSGGIGAIGGAITGGFIFQCWHNSERNRASYRFFAK